VCITTIYDAYSAEREVSASVCTRSMAGYICNAVKHSRFVESLEKRRRLCNVIIYNIVYEIHRPILYNITADS